MRSLDAAQIAARYCELGGEITPGARSMRRGPDTTAITAPPPQIATNPQFVDQDEPDTEIDQLDGASSASGRRS